MTTYKNPLLYGSGMMDTILNTFTQSKYPGEHHYPGYSMLGPGTRLDIRLDKDMKPRPGDGPINDLDNTALKHDIAYQTIQDQYKRDNNKQKALSSVP